MSSRSSRLFLALALFGACASTTAPPRLPRGEPTSSIRIAEALGAARAPDAALFLRLATEELESAKALTKPRDLARANDLRLRARADAELAGALAREATAKAEADDALYEVTMSKDDPGE